MANRSSMVMSPLSSVVSDAPGLDGCQRVVNGWKKYSVLGFRPRPTTLMKAQPGASLYGIEATDPGRIVVFAGGIPLKDGGEVIGAIGVSGGTVDQDQEVAEAGAAAL